MCWNKACNFQLLRKLKDSGMNWNWLCDPTGAVLIAVSIWAFVMVL